MADPVAIKKVLALLTEAASLLDGQVDIESDLVIESTLADSCTFIDDAKRMIESVRGEEEGA